MSGPVLVTGAIGFAGSHVLEQLRPLEPRLAGWANPGGSPMPSADPGVAWQAVDVADAAAVVAAIAALRPKAIYHCAGAADVGGAWTDPAQALRVNVLGTAHLFDAVRRADLACPVLVTGSALIYAPRTTALDEESAIGPTSPYGVSKLAQEMVARSAAWCPILLARPFNHAGPRQAPAYVASSFARQVAAIEAGRAEPVIRVGNLDARRDITDVRDTVRAYRLLVERGTPGRPYNVCSGRAYRVGDLLDALIGLANCRVRVSIDPARLRPSDNPVVLGSAARLRDDTGWRAEIPIERTLADLLDDWRRRLATDGP